MAQITLTNVRKTYPGNVTAVPDLSLEINDGEFIVLVGPSGCGKSTTLRMVAGLEDITAGTIAIGDRIVNRVHPKDRDIAMVFQNYALYPHMTVAQNMGFALKLRKINKAEIAKRVNHAAEMLGIVHLLDRKPRALSGGQRQRVALGRAIVREPQAFLFDEPLSNLDAKLRVTTRAEIKSLHKRLQTTTIYVTHDQEEAMTLGDRVVVMAEGEIQQAASPLTVYQEPANRFVAAFIGTPPMNFFEGTIEQDGDDLYFMEGSATPAGGPQRIRVPEKRRSRLQPHVGEHVVMGVRPQAFMAEPSDTSEGAVFHATIDLVEPLGSDMDLQCSTDKHERLTARVSAHSTLTSGKPIVFGLDHRHIHFFEPGHFGRSILHANNPQLVAG